MSYHVPTAWPISALCAAALLSACLKVPQQSQPLANMEGVDVTERQLRAGVTGLGQRSMISIQTTADQIAENTQDPAVRRQTLIWKADGIPLLEATVLRGEPLIAFVDSWALILQMREYYRAGGGSEAFGDQQQLAVGTLEDLHQHYRKYAVDTGILEATPDSVLQSLVVWLQNHPMQGERLTRASIVPDIRQVFPAKTSQSVFAAVGSIDRSVDALNDRVGLMNEILFKQLRWEAEIAVGEGLQGLGEDSTVRNAARTMAAMGALAEGMPGMIASERAAVLDGIHAERVGAMAEIDRQRLLTLDALSRERAAVLAGLDSQRQALFADIARERGATLAEMDALAARAIERAGREARMLLLEAFLAMALLGAIAAVFVWNVVRRRTTVSGKR